jgi:pimeloyl-ACP methyl ester carboxylesterase
MKLFNLRNSLLVAALMLAGSALPASAATSKPVSAAAATFTTAPTQFIEVDDARLAYRRFGKHEGIPLVFFQHFVGNLDSWDPKVIDGLARNRDVILFDNAGVAGSGGEVPKTIEGMAKYAIDLLQALNVTHADLLGFSMGSLVAQEVTVERPDLVRRLILVGSGPRSGEGMASLTPEFQAVLGKKRDVPEELLLDAFFTSSTASQAAGRQFLTRLHARTVDRDININEKVAPAQIAAFAAWGAPHADASTYLKSIKQPVLVVSGSHDIIHYTVNSFTLQQNLPNAELIVYPDSSHGSLYQYPDLFVSNVTTFLNQAK